MMYVSWVTDLFMWQVEHICHMERKFSSRANQIVGVHGGGWIATRSVEVIIQFLDPDHMHAVKNDWGWNNVL